MNLMEKNAKNNEKCEICGRIGQCRNIPIDEYEEMRKRINPRFWERIQRIFIHEKKSDSQFKKVL